MLSLQMGSIGETGMKFILLLILVLLPLSLAEAAMVCTRTTSTSQTCTAQVSWPASVVDDTHDAPTQYIIQRRDGAGAFTNVGAVTAATLSFANVFTDSGNVAHCWQIIAGNAGGQSGPAPMGCQTSPALQLFAPNAPAITQIAALSNSEIQVTLKDNSDNELGFRVEQTGGTTGTKMYELDANQTILLASGLQAKTKYNYRAQALGDVANSSWSASRWARTLR